MGTTTISFRDKEDPKSTVTIDIQVVQSAISVNQYIKITKASMRNGVLNISYQNNSGEDIFVFAFRIIPYNRFGEIIHAKSIEEDTPTAYDEPRREHRNMLKSAVQIVLVVAAVTALVFGSQQLGIR